MIFCCIIIVIIVHLSFNKIQLIYQQFKDVTKIKTSYVPIELCIKKSQCLRQITEKNYNLKSINTNNSDYNQIKLGKYLEKKYI